MVGNIIDIKWIMRNDGINCSTIFSIYHNHAANAVSVRTAMLFLLSVLNLLRSRLPRVHIASNFSICRGLTLANPNANLQNYFDILTILTW